jgi:hypothetical protein
MPWFMANIAEITKTKQLWQDWGKLTKKIRSVSDRGFYETR